MDDIIDALIRMRDSMEEVGKAEGIYFDQEDNMINAEKIIHIYTGDYWENISHIDGTVCPLWEDKE